MVKYFLLIPSYLLFSFQSVSQVVERKLTGNVNLKTNVLLAKNLSQISFGLEIRSKKKGNVSNILSIIRNRVLTNIENSYTGKTEIDQLRKSLDLKYNRRYYFFDSDMSSKLALFHSPYISLRNRDVYQRGSDGWFVLFPHASRNFTSTSIVLGEDMGFVLFNYKNKLNLEIVVGGGIGKVLFYKSYASDSPTSFHPDFHALLNLGFFMN